MIKKTLILLSVLLPALAPMMQAQNAPGSWTIYSNMGTSIDNIVETPSKVFYLSGGSLYSFSPSDNEHYSYTTSNKLSDVSITDIYYNYDKKYLFVAYSSGNIDLIYDNGKTVNMSDIKIATLTSSHAINDVFFAGNRIYLATDFGLVVYDDERYEVVESGIYNKPLSVVCVLGNYLLVICEGEAFFSPLSERHNTMDKFTSLGKHNITSAQALTDSKYLYVDNYKYVGNATVDFSKGILYTSTSSTKLGSPLKKHNNGFYGYVSDRVYFYDNTGAAVGSIALPDALNDHAVGAWDSMTTMWLGNRDGIGRYDLSAATPVVLNDKYRPNTFTVSDAAFMRWSKDGNRLYVSNIGPSQYYTCTSGDAMEKPQDVNVIENDIISDVTGYDVVASEYYTKSQQTKNKNKRLYGGATRLAEDPDDPEMYFTGNGFEGLFVIKNGVEVTHFNTSNSAIQADWGTRVFDANFDPDGNLWVMSWTEREDAEPLVFLPSAKRKDITNVQPSDWVTLKVPYNYRGNKDAQSLFCEHSNYVLYATSQWESGVLCIDTKGNYSQPGNFVMNQHKSFTDSEGNTITPQRVMAIAEDKDGKIWCGTNEGLFVVNHPSELMNDNLTVKRPLVPRNDGTNFGDYLLETEKIYQIAVDPTNRKWIATEGSGVYLVSADGTEIIENFTTENSPLPSATVYSVACDPHSNKVYFGTANGVLSYNSTSSPASEDFSDVYAYPNPVRPDYNGWITVSGLMDNSLVKIADMAGNVLHQGVSEGGFFVWDGCDVSGNRVKSGVYMVYVSSNASGSNSAAVTKIVVIN